MTQTLQCWKCGAGLEEVPLPLARNAECPVCRADLHVCRMCEFYDTGVANSCREPVAEPVPDKQRANFCGYLRPRPGAHLAAGSGEEAAARAGLSALFGLEGASEEDRARRRREEEAAERAARRGEEEARARDALHRLFGTDEGDDR